MIEEPKAPKRKFLTAEHNAIVNVLEENGIKADVYSFLDNEHGRQITFHIRGKRNNISSAVRMIYSREAVESVWMSFDHRTGATLSVDFSEKKW